MLLLMAWLFWYFCGDEEDNDQRHDGHLLIDTVKKEETSSADVFKSTSVINIVKVNSLTPNGKHEYKTNHTLTSQQFVIPGNVHPSSFMHHHDENDSSHSHGTLVTEESILPTTIAVDESENISDLNPEKVYKSSFIHFHDHNHNEKDSSHGGTIVTGESHVDKTIPTVRVKININEEHPAHLNEFNIIMKSRKEHIDSPECSGGKLIHHHDHVDDNIVAVTNPEFET